MQFYVETDSARRAATEFERLIWSVVEEESDTQADLAI
jgi:hypothetical protein